MISIGIHFNRIGVREQRVHFFSGCLDFLSIYLQVHIDA